MPEQISYTDPCQWTATTTFGIDTVNLTVTGVCQEPTPGYKLTLSRVDVPGSDPDTLLLVLTVVAPTGIEPQHVHSFSRHETVTRAVKAITAHKVVAIERHGHSIEVGRGRHGLVERGGHNGHLRHREARERDAHAEHSGWIV